MDEKQERRKKLKLMWLCILAICLAIWFFWPQDQRAVQTALQEQSRTEETTKPVIQEEQEPEREREKEEQKADAVNQKTIFWHWQGEEAGVGADSYLTLRGDGRYILRVELAGRDPQEVTGRYTAKGEKDEIIYLWLDGEKYRGEIKAGELHLMGKTYRRLEESHF